MIRKKDILIVEDEALFAVMISGFLSDEYNFSCAYTATGEEAVQIAEESCPSLVFMDIRLAGKMDGIEAAQKIRQKSNVPIVFMTAYNCEKTIGRTQEVNSAEYVTKPVDLYVIKNIVQKYCGVPKE